MKSIGILGGMGPLATAELYRRIIRFTKARRDQDHPRVVIDGRAGIPDRTAHIAGRGPSPLPLMIESARCLECAGADFIIMPCNTAHYYLEKLAESVSVPVIDMIRLTARDIASRFGPGVSAGLLATDGACDSGVFDRRFEEAGVSLLKPRREQKRVMEFIYQGVKMGRTDYPADGVQAAVSELRERGASVFALGCTELSAAAEAFQTPGDFIDPLNVLAKEAVIQSGAEVKDDE